MVISLLRPFCLPRSCAIKHGPTMPIRSSSYRNVMPNYIPRPKACKTHSPVQELSQKHPELKPGELRAKAAKVSCPAMPHFFPKNHARDFAYTLKTRLLVGTREPRRLVSCLRCVHAGNTEPAVQEWKALTQEARKRVC